MASHFAANVSAENAHWYSVPAGWTGIAFSALCELRSVDPGISFLQAKEKCGFLRIYYDCSDMGARHACDAIVDKYVDQALATCYACGNYVEADAACPRCGAMKGKIS